jgi:hypothetical protein
MVRQAHHDHQYRFIPQNSVILSLSKDDNLRGSTGSP